ncbi:Hypothetical predicted protein [Paramuricea clavata]|uniref:Uncharacterized protein n=1 Tax=Paramuricea clavata TaxID=317549 RepID=A0A7D9HRP3_PARCT|nr:Hypothetical predicted protein [Paramuricea clavata]
MAKIVLGIPRTRNNRDIMIGGVDLADHDKNLKMVLGRLVAYLFRYIHRFSGICEPLRRLAKANTKFEWDPETQRAFDDLKTALTTEQYQF